MQRSEDCTLQKFRNVLSTEQGFVGHHHEDIPGVWSEDRGLPHGYTATREAAIAAFAKSWRRD
jgi:hypothetical protein